MRPPSDLAKLGTLLDLRVERDGAIVRVRLGRLWLCADARARSLWLVPRPTKAKRSAPSRSHRASKVYRAWTHLVPERETAFTVDDGDGDVEQLGRVRSIAYRSDKWTGREEDYEHDFRGAPRLLKLGDVYRVTGSGVKVTPAGIRG